uniref:Uncharacterized protein n=1 Tax=Rhodnius prolixus TaxID=13249 RepID=T1IBI7_RHOPR
MSGTFFTILVYFQILVLHFTIWVYTPLYQWAQAIPVGCKKIVGITHRGRVRRDLSLFYFTGEELHRFWCYWEPCIKSTGPSA